MATTVATSNGGNEAKLSNQDRIGRMPDEQRCKPQQASGSNPILKLPPSAYTSVRFYSRVSLERRVFPLLYATWPPIPTLPSAARVCALRRDVVPHWPHTCDGRTISRLSCWGGWLGPRRVHVGPLFAAHYALHTCTPSRLPVPRNVLFRMSRSFRSIAPTFSIRCGMRWTGASKTVLSTLWTTVDIFFSRRGRT